MAKRGKTALKETMRRSEADTPSRTTAGKPKHVVTLSEEEVAKLPKALLLFVKTYAEL